MNSKGLQIAAEKSAGRLKITVTESPETPEIVRIKEIRAKPNPTNKDVVELVGLLFDRLEGE